MGICLNCNEKIHDAVAQLPSGDGAKQANGLQEFLKGIKAHKPKEFKAKLDEFVIGQDAAKVALSVAVYNHYKKVVNNVADGGEFIDKSNVLMIGPSGSREDAPGEEHRQDPRGPLLHLRRDYVH